MHAIKLSEIQQDVMHFLVKKVFKKHGMNGGLNSINKSTKNNNAEQRLKSQTHAKDLNINSCPKYLLYL